MKGVSGKNEFSLGLFFIVQESIKVSAPFEDEEKNQPQSTPRPQSVNRQKRNGIMGWWVI
jgi:hypothetical protein